jgi:branched-chain amino acid transport system ATP-binding protein
MALLEVSQLTKNFGGLTALNELGFYINLGELLSIIGPNGSGKTTLFNLITGVYEPTFGIIRFNGKDITNSKPHQVARYGIGRTFQRTTVFRKSTVLDNVIIGRRLHTRTGVWGAIFRTPAVQREQYQTKEKAKEILSFVGLLDKENQTAENITQEAQKRLSIAMALATEPKLLLLDEPTGGVNLEEIDGLTELVKKIQKAGITTCIIEHKMRMVMKISDRVIVLNHGEKIAEGTPKAIAANEEVIKAYLGPRYVVA